MRDAGAIDEAHRAAWSGAWSRATSTHGRLGGVRRAELGAVRTTIAKLARTGALTPSRAPLAFLTLERNRTWWAARPVIGNGARVRFEGSELVWQRYAGQGLQVQWLGTFGAANALAARRRDDDRLRVLLDEALSLAALRAGGIAFESLFTFDKGDPPWVSALSQATAVQALGRAANVLGDARYLEAARQALGIFRTPPPEGIAVASAVGTHYLQYSFNAQLHIVNGFVQAINGLHDFLLVTGDPDARALFAAGEAQLRSELPLFDTGAWSLYAIPGRESDLHYHGLLRDFLQGLCDRLSTDAAQGLGMPDPALYCTTAQRFTADLTTPPVVSVIGGTGRAKEAVALR